jgi:hypothetical protein
MLIRHFLTLHGLTGKERSVEAVAEKCGYNVGTCRIWQMNNTWLDRASAVDAQRWLHEYKEREKLLKKDNAEFVAENRKVKQQSQKIAQKMLNVAGNLLENAELAGKVLETGHVTTKDGRKVPTHTTIEMKAKISDIPRLAEAAVKISRLAADLPTEIIESLPIVADGKDLGSYTIEELEQMQAKNREVLMGKGIQVFDQSQ